MRIRDWSSDVGSSDLLAPLEHLVDLRRIAARKGIREEGAALVIGAMTTQAELLASDLVAARCPILQEAAALIADPQVRYLGTVGGNVANGDQIGRAHV